MNNSVSTSIPLEIAAEVDEYNGIEVIIASFYENNKAEFDPDVRDYGLEIVPLGAMSRTDRSAYWKLLQLARSEEVDILHTHHNSIGSIARGLFSVLDVAIVNTEHRNHQSFSLLQRVANFPTFLAVDEMVSNSQNTRASFYWYEKLFAFRSFHDVVYNGIDVGRIDEFRRQQPNTDIDSDGIQFVSVGRLEEIKNHENILRAFASVNETYPDSRLVLVGDGSRKSQLQTLVIKLGVRDSVQFTGKVPRNEVYRILGQSDLFIIGSNSEGFCVAAIEAMACELPIVASDIETLHEVVGETGIYARPDQPNDFASAISNLVDDDTLRKEIGKDGRKRVINNFRIEQTAEEYYNIYKRAVKGRK